MTEEYARLRLPENQIETMKNFPLTEFSLNICLLNVRSLKLHAIDLKDDDFLIRNDLDAFEIVSAVDQGAMNLCSFLQIDC